MGDFFQISTSSISFLLASMTQLVSNAMPVLLPLLALIIGAWIFEVVVNLSHRPRTYTYTTAEYFKRKADIQTEGGNFLEPRTFELTEEEEEREFGD
jgi:hypothetical protein